MADFPVVDLSDTPGVPDWIEDIEGRFFRTAHDTGAHPNALLIWNVVRGEYGLEPLTDEALWQRHAEEAGWSDDELLQERASYENFEHWQALCRIRDAYQQNVAEIETMPRTNEEYFASVESAN